MIYLNIVSHIPANVGLRHHKREMVFHIDSDASYLIAPYEKSKIAVFFYLICDSSSTTSHNTPIIVECKTLRHIVTSSKEYVISLT